MSIINEVAERRSRDEAIEALRAKVAELKAERDDLVWALLWNMGKFADDEYTTESVHRNAQRAVQIERKYATTAPNGAGA